MSNDIHFGLLQRIGHALFGEPIDREWLMRHLKDAEAAAVLDAGTLSMIQGVLTMGERQVRDVMVQRSQMVVMRRDDDLAALVRVVVDSGHSRYPVIGEDRDEVVGILLAKDLLGYLEPGQDLPFALRDVLRPAVFVPESKRLNVLLREFRQTRNHMAVVVDEYGGVAGLVTIEDVLEQIVGEIEDEYDFDEDETDIEPIDDTSALVRGLTPIEAFNAHFGVTFSDAEFDTVGGLLAHQFGHLPEVGARLEYQDFEFEVTAADARRIEQVRAVRAAPSPDATEDDG
ncbi:HlyC/CorC family transporter [Immundisolibacter sp.]|uniref:HlyC/CorC family transporter n=1 Tax=Immundisolibacter sp. TaxID=1934948 RepID=UPI000ED0B8E5|nr:magnesium/cobalt efflux protein [Gammaproteobacteria bacterium]